MIANMVDRYYFVQHVAARVCGAGAATCYNMNTLDISVDALLR